MATDTIRQDSPPSRFASLDALRGLAILGILAVNAMTFAWPMSLYMAPQAAPFAVDGVWTGADRIAGWAVDVFFTDKFRTLFSLLFGVSVYLVGGERGDAARGRLLRRRLFWLAVFGLLHGLAFWYGDILLLYAWCGLFVMLMRSMSARRLLLIGGGIALGLALLQAATGLAVAHLPPEVQVQMQQGQSHVGVKEVLAAVETYRSGWAGAMLENLKAWAFIQGMSLFVLVFAVVPVMMMGLGLFKAGFLTGRAPRWIYGVLIGLAALNLAVLGVTEWIERGQPPAAAPTGGLAEAAGSFAPLIALGYASVVILGGRLFRLLEPVGRMAFSNYLAQTLIMTTLFYMPWGPGLFGRMSPAALWAVVAAVWATQLVWSPLWLARFRWGPLEWVWRSLTAGRRLPLRRAD